MENLDIRKNSAINAYNFFSNELKDFISLDFYDPLYARTRNSVIHSFEFSLETLAKYLKAYLIEVSKINAESIQSPRSIAKAAAQEKILSADELQEFLKAYDDRNRTSHTYHEPVAENIARNCIEYAKTFESILKKLKINNI